MPPPLRWSSTAVLPSIILLATSVVVARAGHLYLGSGRPVWNNDGDTPAPSSIPATSPSAATAPEMVASHLRRASLTVGDDRRTMTGNVDWVARVA